MKANLKVPDCVIKRLPRYYRYISDLKQMGISRVSSKDLGARMGLTPSQVRQDFYLFGGFGIQGYGYDVVQLHVELRKILGLNQNMKLIIVGVGNLGKAIGKYMMVKKDGYNLIGLFDANPQTVGTVIDDLMVSNIATLKAFVQQNKVQIAALSVPARNARETAALLVDAGIRGILNFTPAELQLPDEIFIENVHITDYLMSLSFKISNDSK